MLVISNLSISHAVFYTFKDKFHHLSNRLFVVCKFFHFDQPKMHNVEGVKLQNIPNSKFFSLEKILLCRSNIRLHLWCLFWLSAFSRLSTIFSVTFFFTIVKILDRVVKDNFYQKYFKEFASFSKSTHAAAHAIYKYFSQCWLFIMSSWLVLHVSIVSNSYFVPWQ